MQLNGEKVITATPEAVWAALIDPKFLKDKDFPNEWRLVGALEALIGQPLNRSPRVEYGLPAHLHRSRDVRADDVVGACEFRWHARIVVGQAQTKRRDAESCQQL